MENALENLFNVKVKKLKKSITGGCINSGSVYQTEDEQLLFVKKNSKLGVIYYCFRVLLLIYYCYTV